MPAEDPSFATVSTSDEEMITVVGRKATERPPDDEFLDIIKISDYLYERRVPTSELKERISEFLRKMGDVVADAPHAFGAYELHEIEFSAEVTLSGDIKLLGVEGKAGIKFLIRRSLPASTGAPFRPQM